MYWESAEDLELLNDKIEQATTVACQAHSRQDKRLFNQAVKRIAALELDFAAVVNQEEV